MTQIIRPILKTANPTVLPLGGHRLRMAAFMLLADLAGLMLAIIFAHLLTADPLPLRLFDPAQAEHLLMLGMMLLVFTVSRLYPGVGINPHEEIRLVVQYSSNAMILSLVLNLVLHPGWTGSPVTGVATWLLSMAGVLIMRWSVRFLAGQAGLWGEPVVVLGRGTQAAELSQYFVQRRRLGFVPVMAITDGARTAGPDCPVSLASMSSLLAGSQDWLISDVHTILIEASFFGQNFADRSYQQLSGRFQHIIFVSDMGWLEGASLAVRDFEGLVGIEARRNVLNSVSSILKRLIDVLGSAAGLLLFSPFLALIALLIKLDSRGPVFYTQVRVGLDGKKIRIYKFRSMVPDAEQALAQYLRSNPQAQLEWEANQKLRMDPRITGIGNFLRKFSLDELPQLFNVLKGEMSLVGPRPIEVGQVQLYGEGIETYRGVRPGMTGLWQVSGRNKTTFKERTRFDTYYVRHWTFWLDLYILLRTVWVVVSRDGAY